MAIRNYAETFLCNDKFNAVDKNFYTDIIVEEIFCIFFKANNTKTRPSEA